MNITKILLRLTIFSVVVYLIWPDEAAKQASKIYRLWVFSDSTAPISGKAQPVADKSRIDALIQRQYQNTLNKSPLPADELSDSEKLRILDDALHELNSAEDAYDREVAVMALGELTGAEAKQGIITALHDESKLVVTQAIHQINRWHNAEERTEMLLAALDSHDDEVVEQTLLTISVVDDKKLVNRLKLFGHHPNPDIRAAAEQALNLAP